MKNPRIFTALNTEFLLPELIAHGFQEISPGSGKVSHPTLDDDFSERQFRDAFYRAMVKSSLAGNGFYGTISSDGEAVTFFPWRE